MKTKHWIYLGCMGILFSCANRSSKENTDLLLEMEVEASKEMSMDKARELLILEKIKAALDQYKLRQSHPEFNHDFVEDLSFLESASKATTIEKIELLKEEVKGDSTQIEFVVHMKDGARKDLDTLQALLTTKEIELEGETLKTTTISFQQ
ncbi:hypothetical protein [Spongiimicrobium salis]|uniref:hypothetical protein n=1 Tax=Spongiimicrobium salis TaxID=1667022 RepID=UPI00374D30C2